MKQNKEKDKEKERLYGQFIVDFVNATKFDKARVSSLKTESMVR